MTNKVKWLVHFLQKNMLEKKLQLFMTKLLTEKVWQMLQERI
jgi:hypothetical protein